MPPKCRLYLPRGLHVVLRAIYNTCWSIEALFPIPWKDAASNSSKMSSLRPTWTAELFSEPSIAQVGSIEALFSILWKDAASNNSKMLSLPPTWTSELFVRQQELSNAIYTTFTSSARIPQWTSCQSHFFPIPALSIIPSHHVQECHNWFLLKFVKILLGEEAWELFLLHLYNFYTRHKDTATDFSTKSSLSPTSTRELLLFHLLYLQSTGMHPFTQRMFYTASIQQYYKVLNLRSPCHPKPLWLHICISFLQ